MFVDGLEKSAKFDVQARRTFARFPHGNVGLFWCSRWSVEAILNMTRTAVEKDKSWHIDRPAVLAFRSILRSGCFSHFAPRRQLVIRGFHEYYPVKPLSLELSLISFLPCFLICRCLCLVFGVSLSANKPGAHFRDTLSGQYAEPSQIKPTIALYPGSAHP